MILNRNTYELFIIDYLDGNLDAVAVSELLIFLEQNPDLKLEAESLGLATLSVNDEALFNNKSQLLKPDYESIKPHFEPLLVAKIENTCTPDELLKIYAAQKIYPQLIADEMAFNNAILVPDLSVIYPNKKGLKKHALVLFLKTPMVRIAATLVAVALLLFVSQNNVKQKVEVAIVESKKPAPTIVVKKQIEQQVVLPKIIVTNSPTAKSIHKTIVPITQKNGVVTQQLPQIQLIKILATQSVIEPKTLAPVLPQPITNSVQQTIVAQNVAPQNSTNDFVDIKAWIKQKTQATFNAANIVTSINKKAGTQIVLEKNNATGKYTKIEIAGISLQRGH